VVEELIIVTRKALYYQRFNVVDADLQNFGQKIMINENKKITF
jgi:hypothetical protein